MGLGLLCHWYLHNYLLSLGLGMRYELCVISDIWEKMLESFGTGGRGKWDLWSPECLGSAQTHSYLHCGWFSLGQV